MDNKDDRYELNERVNRLEDSLDNIKKNMQAQRKLSSGNNDKLDRILNLLTGEDDKKFNPSHKGAIEKIEIMWDFYSKVFWLLGIAGALGLTGGVVSSILKDIIINYLNKK